MPVSVAAAEQRLTIDRRLVNVVDVTAAGDCRCAAAVRDLRRLLPGRAFAAAALAVTCMRSPSCLSAMRCWIHNCRRPQPPYGHPRRNSGNIHTYARHSLSLLIRVDTVYHHLQLLTKFAITVIFRYKVVDNFSPVPPSNETRKHISAVISPRVCDLEESVCLSVC